MGQAARLLGAGRSAFGIRIGDSALGPRTLGSGSMPHRSTICAAVTPAAADGSSGRGAAILLDAGAIISAKDEEYGAATNLPDDEPWHAAGLGCAARASPHRRDAEGSRCAVARSLAARQRRGTSVLCVLELPLPPVHPVDGHDDGRTGTLDSGVEEESSVMSDGVLRLATEDVRAGRQVGRE